MRFFNLFFFFFSVCCEVYEEALKEHPSEKLWSLYIETLNELAVILEPLKTFIENTLISVLFRGHKAAMLEESAYIQLVIFIFYLTIT